MLCHKSIRPLFLTVILTLFCYITNSQETYAKTQTLHDLQQDVRNFSHFTPQPSVNTRIDYDIWDSLLESMVVFTGQSLRKRASRPHAETGSRIARGHVSPYRLEGNRIPFSVFEENFSQALSLYRQDLEALSHQLDITKLSRKEQLAYWMNLHNVAIIEQLALRYPVRSPSAIRIGEDKARLHDAKILTIAHTPLSLRDIREKIVYPHWQDPLVIYGFFLGDIGSPTVHNSAFSANNVNYLLERGAREFTSSLRGFTKKRETISVSRLYQDVAPFYFRNFDADVIAHIQQYAREDVKLNLSRAKTVKIANYDGMIADLTAGQGVYRSPALLRSTDRSREAVYKNGSLGRFLREIRQKRLELEKQGLFNRGTVIIEDLPQFGDSENTRQSKEVDEGVVLYPDR